MKMITNQNRPSLEDDQLLGLETVAGLLGLSVWTIRKWVCEGKIKSVKLGSRRLIKMVEVRRLISDATNKGVD